MRQTVYLGDGCLAKLNLVLKHRRPKTVFLVTAGHSFKTSGAKRLLEPILEPYSSLVFSDFRVNPKIEDVRRGISIFRQAKPDLVIAVGGGSVLDVAKTINLLAANPGQPEDFVIGKKVVDQPGRFLVAIPTTAGSGSESTHFAVVYIDETKYSLAHPYVLPSVAIVDPQFTRNLPPRLTAISGMDALTQAVEAYWSVNSTRTSKRFSLKAIKLIRRYLARAVNQPGSDSRLAMVRAANYAGRAINIAQTTACHAISYPLTAHFGVPHGHAVSLTLASLFRYNALVTKSDISDKRGIVYVRRTIHRLSTFISAKYIQKLMISIGLETRLSRLGINVPDAIQVVVNHGFNPQRMRNNPRLLSRNNLKIILDKLI